MIFENPAQIYNVYETESKVFDNIEGLCPTLNMAAILVLCEMNGNKYACKLIGVLPYQLKKIIKICVCPAANGGRRRW